MQYNPLHRQLQSGLHRLLFMCVGLLLSACSVATSSPTAKVNDSTLFNVARLLRWEDGKAMERGTCARLEHLLNPELVTSDVRVKPVESGCQFLGVEEGPYEGATAVVPTGAIYDHAYYFPQRPSRSVKRVWVNDGQPVRWTRGDSEPTAVLTMGDVGFLRFEMLPKFSSGEHEFTEQLEFVDLHGQWHLQYQNYVDVIVSRIESDSTQRDGYHSYKIPDYETWSERNNGSPRALQSYESAVELVESVKSLGRALEGTGNIVAVTIQGYASNTGEDIQPNIELAQKRADSARVALFGTASLPGVRFVRFTANDKHVQPDQRVEVGSDQAHQYQRLTLRMELRPDPNTRHATMVQN